MRLIRALVAVAGLLLALPTGAGAQSAASTSSGGAIQIVSVSGSGAPQFQQASSVRISGALTVTFHGDPATGCAASGLCGYSGSVIWRPPTTGSLEIITSHAHHHTTSDVSLLLEGNGIDAQGGQTSADVQSIAGSPSGAATCLDAETTGSSVNLPVRHGRVAFSLGDATPGLLTDRCAGPRAPQILPQLPTPSLTLGALRRDGTTLDLNATRPFAAGGFAGTIDSTIVITLGRAGRPTRLSTNEPRTGTRYVAVTADYRVRVAGSVVEHVAGDANPAICAPLGACGVTGTQTLTARAQSGTGQLTAYVPATLPRARALAAVGLGGARPPSVISAIGFTSWGGNGTFATALGQSAAECRQTTALGRSDAELSTAHGRLAVALLPQILVAGTPITECPGPEPGLQAAVAEGQVPLRALRRGRVQVVLRTGSRLADDGYSVSTSPDLTMTLTRLGVHTTEITLPGGFVP